MSTVVLLAMAAPLAVLGLALRLRGWAVAPPRRPAPVASAVTVVTPSRGRWRRLPRRRARPLDELEVAAWCERVGGAMRAGRSLTAAVIDADASVRDGRVPFPDVVHAVRRGRSIGDAFRGVAADPSTPIGLAAPVLATCAELGGPNARAHRRRRRHPRRPRRRAGGAANRQRAGPPVGPGPEHRAVRGGRAPRRHRAVRPRTPSRRRPGWRMVTLGLAMNAAGWLWMTAMVRAAS